MKVFQSQLLYQQIPCDTNEEALAIVKMFKDRSRIEVVEDFDTKKQLVRIVHPLITVMEP